MYNRYQNKQINGEISSSNNQSWTGKGHLPEAETTMDKSAVVGGEIGAANRNRDGR